MADFEKSIPPPPFPSIPPPSTDDLGGGRRRRTIAVGGGRGGVGKTVLTANLGVFFAQLGREVVVCDADPFGSSMYEMLGLEMPPLVTPEALEEGNGEPVPTSVPGLKLLPIACDRMTGIPMRPTRAAHWLKQIATLDADYVLIHLGASSSSSALDLFLQADLGVAVAAPDPLAIETTYRFMRALYFRILRRAMVRERFKTQIVERVIAELPPLSSPRKLISEIRRHDEGVAILAAEQLARISPHLVISQTRTRADLDLGAAMAAISSRFLGIDLDYLGHIEHDDAVWLTIRKKQPLLIESPTSKAARNVERVARRILALLTARETRSHEPETESRLTSLLGPSMPPTLYDVLGVTPSATDDELRRAYKRQREVFHEGSLPITSVVGPEILRHEQSAIEEAHETLLDPVRRRAYDLSTFPDDAPVSARIVRPSPIEDAAREVLQAELARQINSETQFTGALLRRFREAHGIELSDIAQTTKISVTHLSAIENDSPKDLPALVYVQGFVQQFAKCLKLDPAQVTKTYMRHLREIPETDRSRNSS